MSTYPHHKHENDQVSPSHRVTIIDVLDHIEKDFNNKALTLESIEVYIWNVHKILIQALIPTLNKTLCAGPVALADGFGALCVFAVQEWYWGGSK